MSSSFLPSPSRDHARPLPPLLILLPLLLLCSLPSLSSALHDAGFTWSATAAQLPGAVTDYVALAGPQAHLYQYQIYVLFKQPSSTGILYMTYNWDGDRTWVSSAAVDDAASYGGGSVTEYYGQPVAIWSDASTSTLTFSIQDTNYNSWGDQLTSTYSAHQSPPNLFTPTTAEMFVFHRAADFPTFGNCSYDGYTVFSDYPSGTLAYSHGSSAVTNTNSLSYLFYLGANSDGSPDGYLHWMYNDQISGFWSADTATQFPVDTDSTISAVPWSNNTDTWLFVFYKYQSNLQYVVFFYEAGGYFWPPAGTTGYPLGLTSDTGPSAVVYYDPYFDTQIVTIFFAQYSSSANAFLVYNAIGMPDNWP